MLFLHMDVVSDRLRTMVRLTEVGDHVLLGLASSDGAAGPGRRRRKLLDKG